MEDKRGRPGIGWVSSRLSRKAIVAIVVLGLVNWAVMCAAFVGYMGRYVDPALRPVFSRSVFLVLLCINLVVFAVAAVLLFLLTITPIIRLRRIMRRYYETGEEPERTSRADEIGRLQNTFADLTGAVGYKEQAERRLIASISHDIKTPLTSVLGYSERLRSAELSEETRRQYLDRVYEKALRIQAVVEEFDQYLDVGLRESAAMVLTTAGELCGKLREEYAAELSDAGADFRVECTCPGEQMVCNWEHFRRLFGNLIGNAFQHSGADKLSLELTCRREGDRVVFLFSDNGRGVAPELLGQIFEPLYTSDAGRKVSGLGLSICRSIVKAHGGAITAENRPSGGLCLRMTFPRVQI